MDLPPVPASFISKKIQVVAVELPTVAVGEVAALNHEGFDDTVETGPLVAISLFSGGQSSTMDQHVFLVSSRLKAT